MPVRPRTALSTMTIAAATLCLAAVGTLPANAATAKHYSSCAQLQKFYPHGVGKSGAKDKTSGKPVTTFRVDTTLYKANDGPRNAKTGEYDLDRDNDGIACEKR